MDLGSIVFTMQKSLPQKMVVFYTLNATPKDLTNMGMHSCYSSVVLRKSDIFSIIFDTYLLLMMFGFREQV